MLKPVCFLASLTVVVALAGDAPARADDIWGDVACGQLPRPGCELGAGVIGHNGVESPGHNSAGTVPGGDHVASDGPDCRNVPVDYKDPAGQQPAGEGGWFMVLCSPDGKDPDSHGPVWIAKGAEATPTLTPAQVAQMARNRLRLPEVVIAASPSNEQLVNLPTWLWLEGGWQQVTATAGVPGVSVTAVATPTSVTWSMGDGGSLVCETAGSAFPTGGDPAAESPDCGYTFRTSSSGQPEDAFPVTATVSWTVNWSGAGQTGTFPNMAMSTSTSFRVAEVQAIASG
ncbi:hypothetical protein [Umezawaea sp. NPDC059074]|uniref:hypothetical protein n=1 Tax=Umezawaea sp. NPDC059074 TaxID=3346716 RepID=UPI0036B6D38A